MELFYFNLKSFLVGNPSKNIKLEHIVVPLACKLHATLSCSKCCLQFLLAAALIHDFAFAIFADCNEK